jgi:hypothetical protein
MTNYTRLDEMPSEGTGLQSLARLAAEITPRLAA